MPAIKPLTPVTLSSLPPAPKVARSFSVSSIVSSSSASSTYSRSADDMLDRLAAQDPNVTIQLWSAGNVRLNNLDLTIPARDAAELIQAMRADDRFEFVTLQHLSEEGDDWKISFRRTSPPTTPILSDSE